MRCSRCDMINECGADLAEWLMTVADNHAQAVNHVVNVFVKYEVTP